MNIKKTTCEICGKEYSYNADDPREDLGRSNHATYDASRFCSPKCHYKSVAKKSFATFRANNPGVSGPYHLPGVQDKVKRTVMERYGVEHMGQSKEIIQKRKDTCLKKYGTETPLANKEIHQKTHDSNVKNHNGKHYFNTEEGRKLAAE